MHESIRSRGHEDIRGRKFEGLAIAAMLEAGIVKPEDKDGNDWAKVAAGEGTHKHIEIATMARKYSIRNERYRGLMSQTHNFIIKIVEDT